ncbi:helix-turn-helix domain-containing protein [Paenibacillus sp. B01]|uniref:helix-turn-helix domain-containing protein n=1 Tax=Paenibacillus sp. B01 TaxID=2660554 RepID=UPI001E3D5928|nr:helix-turn-helix transcriptional regulator [Paenibacillus sp. B01]
MGIGTKIRHLRKKLSFNQSQFAALLGISQGTLSDIENEKYTPSFETLVSLNQQIGIDFNWMLGNNPSEDITVKDLDGYEDRITSKFLEFLTNEALHLSHETERSVTPKEISLILRRYFSTLFPTVEVDADELIWLTKYRSLTPKDKKEVDAIIDLKYTMNFQV